MVKAKNKSSSFLYEPRTPFPKLPEVRFHDTPERSLYHLFDTAKESIYGINLAKNCPFQPFHPLLSMNFEMLDYSLPRQPERNASWETKFCKKLPDSILIGQNYEPFAPFEKTRTLAIALGKFLVNQGFKIWFQTRTMLDLELFETLLYLEEKVQLLLPFHTLNDRIAKLIEPFSPAPTSRIKQLETLKNLGIPFEVSLDSLIPGLNDTKANLFPLLESLADKGVKRTTISFMNLQSETLSHSIKQNSQFFSLWEAGVDFEFPDLRIRKLLNSHYRKAKYSEIMTWGKQVGIQIVVDGIANPDFARRSPSEAYSVTSNLKERYLALTNV